MVWSRHRYQGTKMGSRSNDDNQEKAYGDTGRPMLTSYTPPAPDAGRPRASPANPAAVKQAMAADRGTTKPMSYSAPSRVLPDNVNMPFAKRGQAPTGMGGAARQRKIDELVDKTTDNK